MGRLGGAAAGAGMGFAVGGPVGAAIGAGVGALTSGGGGSPEMRDRGRSIYNVAEQQFGPYVNDLGALGKTNLADYSGWLNKLTSPDSANRTAAAATQIADLTKQRDTALRQIAALPRGGEKNMLMGQTQMNTASQIGGLLTNLYTMAQKSKGELGQWGTGAYMSGIGQYANMEKAAADILFNNKSLEAMGDQASMQALGQLATLLASG